MREWLGNLLLRLIDRTGSEPEAPKVRAICHHCGDFHDGHYRYCEACLYAVAPAYEVELQVVNRVDAVEWEVQ